MMLDVETIASKYAHALFAVSKAENLDRFLHLINTFELLMTGNILSFFKNPIILLDNKKKVLKEIFSSSFAKEGKLGETLFHFLELLLERQRFGFIKEIFKKFRSFANDSLGILEGKLITAQVMSTANRQHLEKKLETKFGKKILLKETVDPSLVGGAVVLLAHHVIDFSIKGKLAKLKKYLTHKENS